MSPGDEITEPSDKTRRRRRRERVEALMPFALITFAVVLLGGVAYSVVMLHYAHTHARAFWHPVDQCVMICADPPQRPTTRLVPGR